MRENRLAVKSTMQIYEIYIKLYTKHREISIVVLPEYGLWNQESFVTFDSGRLSAVCGHPESKNGVSCKNPAFFRESPEIFPPHQKKTGGPKTAGEEQLSSLKGFQVAEQQRSHKTHRHYEK